jgi:proteasome accessory factor A
MTPVDKILGADVELGNVIESAADAARSNDRAARLLLAEIDGVPSDRQGRRRGSAYGFGRPAYGAFGTRADDQAEDPQDWGRKFLAGNGGCAYIDLGHLEVCMPEVRSAIDFVRYHHAGLALARAAREAAQARLGAGERLVVMANNSDRQGNSWGGHLNVLITRELWRRVFDRMHPALFVLAAFQVSSILYTGQGKVGSENGKPWVPFQLTQRGDFFECIEGLQTTYRRPIVNSRDEPHAGGGLARLHVIFHDTTLTHASNYLKSGATQLVLALMETGWCDRQVMLEDPLAALTAWGHDPDLQASAALDDGRSITAIEHQRLFLEAVKGFIARGDAGAVPGAAEIAALWEDTLDRLEGRDIATLARRLDWVLKRELLARAIERSPGLTWESPSIRAADLRFASLEPGSGLYAAVEAGGGVDRLFDGRHIELALATPPEDTRAWTRSMLLRHLDRHRIASIDWSEIQVHPSGAGHELLRVRLADPRRHGRFDNKVHQHGRDAGAAEAVH